MHIPKHFALSELIPPQLFNQRNGDPILWLVLDERLLITLDRLRERYGRMIINNWRAGGVRRESGLREMSSTTGAPLSQHRFGRAADVLFMAVGNGDAHSPEIVREDMRSLGLFDRDMRHSNDPRLRPFKYINRVEWYANGVPITWFHFDIGNQRNANGGIRIVNV